ncbi:MAG: hypothetical protein ACFCGT_23805 [Sandaracinaceae bacterium]
MKGPDRANRLRDELARTLPAPRHADRSVRRKALLLAGRIHALGVAPVPDEAALQERLRGIADLHLADLDDLLVAREAAALALTDALADGADEATVLPVLDELTEQELRFMACREAASPPARRGADERWSEASDLARAALDGVAYLLVAHNARRVERLYGIAAEHRRRFWWLSEGAGIDPAALVALPAVAEMVAAFPEAAEELQRLAATWTLVRRGDSEDE